MCLITAQKKPKITLKDKVVYKILGYGLYTPYNHFKYELGVLYKIKIEEEQKYKSCCFDDEDTAYLRKKYGFDYSFDIDNGKLKSFGPGFHSALNIKRFISHAGTIYKCIIPAGSEYYNGVTGLVVSNQIIIVAPIQKRYDPRYR